jgi:hypothetical protein
MVALVMYVSYTEQLYYNVTVPGVLSVLARCLAVWQATTTSSEDFLDSRNRIDNTKIFFVNYESAQ